MASEASLVHDPFVSSSNTNQASRFIDGALSFQISRGVEVLSRSQQFPYSNSTYALKSEHSIGGFTQSFWSDASLSPVVGSSACSTETEINEEEIEINEEEEEDFMVDLAEQMTHFMLDNDEEEKLDSPADTSSSSSLNSLPFSLDSEIYNSRWPSGGFCSCSSTETLTRLSESSLSNPTAWNDATLELLHSVEAGRAALLRMESLNIMREHAQSQNLKQPNNEASLGRKIEKLLRKQALQKVPPSNPHLPMDPSSLGRGESAVGSCAPTGSNSRSLNGVETHCWKLREYERKPNTNRCRYPKHGSSSYSWIRHGKSKQQYSPALGHGRSSAHSSRTSDQHAARMLDPAAFAWKATSNPSKVCNIRALFLGGSGLGRESAGTGVFLPRCTGNNFDSKRKAGYPAHTSPATPHSSMVNFGTTTGNSKYYSHQGYLQSYSSSRFHQSSRERNLPFEWTYHATETFNKKRF